MNNTLYNTGFLDGLALLEKKAQKSKHEMTDEEKARAAAYAAERAKARDAATPKRIPYKVPQSIREELSQAGTNLKHRLISLGKGATSAAKTMGMRALNTAANYALWLPSIADQYIFGKLIGVDNGKGLLGRGMANFDRWTDKKISKWRRESSDYDYIHRIGGGFNRFLTGTAADFAGSTLGGLGIGGLVNLRKAKSWLGKAFPIGLAGVAGAETLMDGRAKQLREREAFIRSLHPSLWDKADPTSTVYHQQAAPTKEEYHRYNIPAELPATISGKIRIPTHWSRTEDGTPTIFRPYGT